jgi:hypothetical protein
MDTTQLQDAYRALVDAAITVADSGDPAPAPGEWNADQILAHVSIINAITLAAVSSIASGANTTYDNRLAQDLWNIDHVVTLASGNKGLQDRIHCQAEALCTLVGPTLSQSELETPIPTRLVSNNTILVDQPMPLRDLITGLAEGELPGHTTQLQNLLNP